MVNRVKSRIGNYSHHWLAYLREHNAAEYFKCNAELLAAKTLQEKRELIQRWVGYVNHIVSKHIHARLSSNLS